MTKTSVIDPTLIRWLKHEGEHASRRGKVELQQLVARLSPSTVFRCGIDFESDSISRIKVRPGSTDAHVRLQDGTCYTQSLWGVIHTETITIHREMLAFALALQ